MGNTYKLILEALSGSDINALADPKDQQYFLDTLHLLIAQEDGHAAMADRYRGKVERIR